MTAPAAITAQLVDVRNVAAHKSVRLELHVPAEQAGLVMAAFGWPTMADPVPVALARLTIAPEPIAKPEAPKERRPFSELPYSQQAAMRCQDNHFWDFLESKSENFWREMRAKYGGCANAATAMVRKQCGVDSRAEINKGLPSGDRWEAMDAEFYAWSHGMRQ